MLAFGSLLRLAIAEQSNPRLEKQAVSITLAQNHHCHFMVAPFSLFDVLAAIRFAVVFYVSFSCFAVIYLFLFAVSVVLP